MTKSKKLTNDDRNFINQGEASKEFSARLERLENPHAEITPQVGRPPNRPPYEQHLRVTKAFLK